MEEAEQEQQRSGPWKRLYGSLCKKAAGTSHLTMKNNEGERSSNKTVELEEANLQLQKLHPDLMWKAMILKTEGKGKTAQSKYHWYRSHKGQEQQTDLLSEKPERQDTDSAVLGLRLQKYLQDLKQEAAKHQTKTSFCLKVKLSSKECRRWKPLLLLHTYNKSCPPHFTHPLGSTCNAGTGVIVWRTKINYTLFHGSFTV